MPKEFYTEKDIEDLFQRGIRSLRLGDDVVLTELAYEKARRLDFQLITDRAETPPAAPVRPYISEPQTRRPGPAIAPGSWYSDRDSRDGPPGGDERPGYRGGPAAATREQALEVAPVPRRRHAADTRSLGGVGPRAASKPS